ncbi:hypothetical protein OJF2_02180 [Aquisphaera giovannonii]|uniref:Uncharacterized protein n=1 Tax=Aquisphaera giovannonii TaxID=406548 RepID=A0A5B9VTR6_9BACT|nr:hypothetical protein [Aquisphaera giovannonii]QEH31753.1 hypothetical protein OJF2_02180 [Aquisphaera giovannonii]
MPIVPKLYKTIRKAIENAYPSPDDLSVFLLDWGYELETFASLNLSRPHMYSKVIRGIAARGLIREFLARLKAERAENSKVQEAWLLYATDTGSYDADEFNACLLGDAGPCWDRTKLRAHVRELLTGGKRTMVVRGATGSGRTFTYWYIEHVARFHNARPFYLDMKRKPTGPDDVARLIAGYYGWSLETLPKPHAQKLQWAEEIGEWVAGRVADMAARGAPGSEFGFRVVLVFDNTCAAGLRTETKALVVYLADRAAGEEGLRVVLLAHQDPYKPPARHRVNFDNITPPSKTDFYDFLAAYNRHKGYSFDEEALTAVANSAWAPITTPAGLVLMDDLVTAAEEAMAFLDRNAVAPGTGPASANGTGSGATVFSGATPSSPGTRG